MNTRSQMNIFAGRLVVDGIDIPISSADHPTRVPTIEYSDTAAVRSMDAPLVLSPKHARRVLNIGTTHLYKLLKQRELQSYADGRSRKIVYASIEAYIARQLAVAGAGDMQPHVAKAATAGRAAQRARRSVASSTISTRRDA